MITGAQAVVDCLRRERVGHVFGIPGTDVVIDKNFHAPVVYKA